jgi:aminomethyltransferase
MKQGGREMAEKRTPLYDVHVASGAKVIEFGGWLMPVQYTGILEEHRAVREKAGLFDVSHMGEIKITGPQAKQLINQLITNDVSKLVINQVQYSPLCYDDGGVVDDLLVYRLAEEEYVLVVNAGNIDKDFAWIKEHSAGFAADVKNLSQQVAELALQGPRAEFILQQLTKTGLTSLHYYWLQRDVQIAGVTCLLSRTGYTGEDGFEIYCRPAEVRLLWETLLAAGKQEGLVAAGLGARDTLRFEAGLPLYGHELSATISPLEAGLGMFVKLDKADFIGKAALAALKAAGLSRKVVGVEMLGRGIARAGYECYKDGRRVGVVTSGSYAPTLDKNLAVALLDAEVAVAGTPLSIAIRGKLVDAVLIKKPFYKKKEI